MKKEFGLSKSKVIQGIQCPKALYFSKHNPELKTEPSSGQLAIFETGHAVGRYAQKWFPEGILIDTPRVDGSLALELTDEAIKNGALALFEAAFVHEGVLIRADIISRTAVDSPWDLFEVKSSTEVKDVHLQDAAIQAWVMKGAGIRLGKVSIMYVNNQCTYPDLSDLFSTEDVTQKLKPLLQKVPEIVSTLKGVLAKPATPEIEIGPRCDSPYECEYKSHCWGKAKVPDLSVLDIPRLNSKKKWALFNRGIITPKQALASGESFNEIQSRMLEVTASGKRFLDTKPIKKGVSDWDYPFHYFDFETTNPAIPRHEGAHPYQMIPFQFSCHVTEKPGAKLKHYEYLHDDLSDPREPLILAMLKCIGKTGSVIAYNKTFEATRIKELARDFPKYAKQLLNISKRLVDPLPLVRASIYDKGFLGGFSLKEVGVSLLGDEMAYAGMTVGDGTEAQNAFEEMIAESTGPARKAELKNGLLKYCEKDTYVMVELVEWMMTLK